MVRTALERMYQDTCSIVERRKVRVDGVTEMEDVTVQTDVLCRLSIKTAGSTNQTDAAAAVYQDVKLFLSPDLLVKAGSKVIVTHEGRVTEYKSSGVPAVYQSHQEITLKLFERWA